MGVAGRSGIAAVAIVLAGGLLPGCAKEPATVAASAPPPAGAGGVRPAAPGAGSGRAGQVLGDVGLGDQAAALRGTARSGQASGSSASGRSGGDAARRPPPKEFTAVAELQDIFFEFDRYDISPESARLLQANAAWLRARPSDIVLIEGHCDERGTDEYNVALGEHRAASTKNFLIAQGVAPGRIMTISYGELLPACDDGSEGCWAQNRRARFLVKRQQTVQAAAPAGLGHPAQLPKARNVSE